MPWKLTALLAGIAIAVAAASLAGWSAAADQAPVPPAARPTTAVGSTGPGQPTAVRRIAAARPAEADAIAPVAPATTPASLELMLASLGVAAIEDETDDLVRTTHLLDAAGDPVGRITRPLAPVLGRRTIEVELEGKSLRIEVEPAPAPPGAPTVRLFVDGGREIVAGSGARLPDAYRAHIDLADAFQRDANPPLSGDEPIELARDRGCSQETVSGHGVCYGDCADLACRRAHAGLNHQCADAGGCCEIADCAASCTRVSTESGDRAVVCSADQHGRISEP